MRESFSCPGRAAPSFGTSPKYGGAWTERTAFGTNFYSLDCEIRAGGKGASSGGGLWQLAMPHFDGYRLYIDPPDFISGGKRNSILVGVSTIGMSTGAHMPESNVHTRTGNPPSAADEKYLVFVKKGGLFIGGDASWVPANVHVRTLEPIKCKWVAEA